jgi:hypothetical protein
VDQKIKEIAMSAAVTISSRVIGPSASRCSRAKPGLTLTSGSGRITTGWRRR